MVVINEIKGIVPIHAHIVVFKITLEIKRQVKMEVRPDLPVVF